MTELTPCAQEPSLWTNFFYNFTQILILYILYWGLGSITVCSNDDHALTLTCLFALWSLAGKGLSSSLSFVMFYYVFVTFPYGNLGQVCYLFVLIPDLCHLSNFTSTLIIDWKVQNCYNYFNLPSGFKC